LIRTLESGVNALPFGKTQALSENYAKQLYTRKYLRGVSVTGRLGDIQVNEDGSKTMPTERSSSRHLSSCKNNKSGWSFKV
jgi:hypothetical protein